MTLTQMVPHITQDCSPCRNIIQQLLGLFFLILPIMSVDPTMEIMNRPTVDDQFCQLQLRENSTFLKCCEMF